MHYATKIETAWAMTARDLLWFKDTLTVQNNNWCQQ